MNKGYITALVIVLLVLMVIYAITTTSRGTGTVKKPEDIKVQIDSTAVEKIELDLDGENVELVKKSGEWHMTSPVDFIADQNLVKRLASSFQDAAIDVEISNNPENHSKYQLDDENAKKVKITHDGGVLELLVGKSGPGGVTYVRLSGDDRVFSLTSRVSSAIRGKADDYRSKRVWFIEQEDIKATKAQSPEAAMYLLADTDSTYKVSASEEGPWVEPVFGKAQNYLRGVAQLRASSFIDDPDSVAKLDFSSPAYNVGVTTKDGEEHTLNAIAADEKADYFIATKDGQAKPVWVVHKGALGRLVRELDYMTTQEAPPTQQPQQMMNSNQEITPEMRRKIQEAMMKQGMGG